MAKNTSSKATSGQNNGFFGAISESLGNAIGQTAGLLPIWAANELGVQTRNQMAAPTFNPNAAPPRSGNPPVGPRPGSGTDVRRGRVPTTGVQRTGSRSVQDTSANQGGSFVEVVDQLLGVQVGDVSLSGTTILLIAGAAAAGIALAR